MRTEREIKIETLEKLLGMYLNESPFKPVYGGMFWAPSSLAKHLVDEMEKAELEEEVRYEEANRQTHIGEAYGD